MANELELFTFDFPFLNAAPELLSCPNCGYVIHKSTPLISKGLSKSLLVGIGGALLYWNYFKRNQFRAALLDVRNTLQYYGSSLFALLNGSAETIQSTSISSSSSNSSKPWPANNAVRDNVYHLQANITNQWLQCSPPQDDSNLDLSSITFSSLNSIGSSTVAKFDYLLDQVQQIKDTMNDSYCELHGFRSSNCSLNERRLSESEITMPSLEWDLGDTPLEQGDDTFCNDGFHHFGGKKQSFLYNVKYNGVIDTEMLSQIIFNKDFDFKERIYDNIDVNKYFASLRHQLQNSSKLSHRKAGGQNLSMCKSNRDSAFFED